MHAVTQSHGTAFRRLLRAACLASSLACACSSPARMQQDPLLVMKATAGAPAAGSGGQPLSMVSAGSGAAGGSAGQPATAAGDCCEAQPAAACAPQNVEQCVCAQVPSCCQSGWDV